jgi:hypothetical protein
MRAYNSIRNWAFGFLTGLAAVVSGNCDVAPVGVGLNLVPATITSSNVIKSEMCEEDAKNGEVKIAEWTVAPECVDLVQTNGCGAEVENWFNEPIPFNIRVSGEDTNGDGKADFWALYARDNGNQLANGETRTYNLQVRPSSNFAFVPPMGGLPPISFPGLVFTGNGGFDIRDFKYTNCVTDENEPPYAPNDGVCDAAHGENFANSPEDCSHDGICDTGNGENCQNSPIDCLPAPCPDCPTPEDLFKRSYTAIAPAGSPRDIASNPAGKFNRMITGTDNVARLYLDPALETLVEGPTSVSITARGYTGPGDCFTVSSVGTMSRIGMQDGFVLYETPFTTNRTPDCGPGQEMEEIESDYFMRGFYEADGNTPRPIADSEFDIPN